MTANAAPDNVATSIADAPTVLELDIGGMTCASCAARVEKKLNRMPGVEASVNYATERARVSLPEGTDVAAAIATVEATGYTAALPETPAERAAADSDEAEAPDPELVSLRQRLQISAALTIPVVVLSMIPALQFTYWQWAALALASPVVVWGAWPFHRAAFVNARHGATTMDTLISIGVTAAYVYSLWALFLGGAGITGMTMTGSDPDPPGRCHPAHLPRDRRSRHHLRAPGALPRGPGQAQLRRGPARPAGHGRQGRGGASRWGRAADSGGRPAGG